ncbi:MAG: hypothetical protein NUV63_01065 [Gallionella sp.]|nr:hypothetical protein [Gallionella sp.]
MFNYRKLATIGGVCLSVLVAGCGGGGSGGGGTSGTSTLSGTAAVGYPIVGGTINVSCAAGSALNTTTNSTGGWQVTVSGQTLPCAVQVSGGTINGGANSTPYHSITTAWGTVNVTPLTDLMVANLAGAAALNTWFTGLNSATLTAINQTGVDAALTQLRTALALTPLNTINPITTAFTPTPGNISDDMLAALATAMTNAGVSYSTLLTSASQTTITAPAGLGAALTTAYAGTTSGSGGSGNAGTLPSGVTGKVVTMTYFCTNNPCGPYTHGQQVLFTFSSNGTLMLTAQNTVVSTTFTVMPNPNPIFQSEYQWIDASGQASGTTGTKYTLALTNNAPAGEILEVNINSASDTFLGQFNTPVSSTGGGGTGTSGQMGGAIQGTPLNLTTAVTTIAGYVSAIPVPITDGTGIAASFYFPFGVTTDGTNLYVVDSAGNIRQIVIATGAVSTIAGTTLGTTGSTDGTGTAAKFALPRGITTDGTNLYVADTGNSTIRKIVIATGAVSTLAGTAGSNGITDGTGAAARFYLPSSITTDGTNLYVADTGNHTIRQIVIATGAVTTLAGTASPFFGWGSTDATGTAAKFSGPAGITTDGTNLYVADTGNNAIRKIVIATGAVTTLAGGAWGSTDDTGTAALFYAPTGIVTDGTNLYVTDGDNYTIRKIVIATGVVTTLAGTGWGTAGWGSAWVDGTGAAARFSRSYGITTDGANLYVADTLNTTIRKIQ